MTAIVCTRATDAQLLTAIAHDDVSAFEELFSRYAGRAIAVASALSLSRADAEDCVQDAFVAIWKNRASYVEGRGSAAGWVLGITRNRAIDLRRRRTVREGAQKSEAVERLVAGDDTQATADMRAQAEQIGELLRGLPVNQREVVALAFYGQLTFREIAAHLDLSEAAIKGRMRLGLAKLRVAGASSADLRI